METEPRTKTPDGDTINNPSSNEPFANILGRYLSRRDEFYLGHLRLRFARRSTR